MRRARLVPALLLLLLPRAPAQEVPFLTPGEFAWLSNEISGDAAYEHVRWYSHWHRNVASEGLRRAAEYTAEKAREAGLSGVRVLRQEGERGEWNVREASLWLIEPEIRNLADIHAVRLHLADRSASADLEAPLLDVGAGDGPSAYEGKDVTGAVVLAHGPLGTVFRRAVWERKAAGVVWWPGTDAFSYPDQIRWTSVPVEEGRPGGFAFVLSVRDGADLRERLKRGPARVRARVVAETGPAWQVMVEATIPGTEVRDQDVVFTAHLQEERFSANDDSSGCANQLELSRALAKLIQEGRLGPPRRTLRFWWTTEISSEYRYFSDHPEAARGFLVNINQDMVGANQAQDVMRVQNVTRTPFSRAHFLDDVVEGIVGAIVEGNTGYLHARFIGARDPYTRALTARLGTRHRYNARIIPFHTSTDHMCFNDAPIGVPGITFTNWPDHYIHTSDDDLWNLDPTQLRRNAVAVAAIGWTIGRMGPGEVRDLGASVYAGALARLATDFRAALREARRPAGDRRLPAAVVRRGAERELQALRSVAALDRPPREGNAALLSDLERSLETQRDRHLSELGRFLEGPEPEPAEAEASMRGKVPRLPATPREFYEARRRIQGGSGALHSLMAYEALNFVDGRRSFWDIYECLAAEAAVGGEHLYGRVTPAAAGDYLDRAAAAGAILLPEAGPPAGTGSGGR